jgi:hypothetical protein
MMGTQSYQKYQVLSPSSSPDLDFRVRRPESCGARDSEIEILPWLRWRVCFDDFKYRVHDTIAVGL